MARREGRGKVLRVLHVCRWPLPGCTDSPATGDEFDSTTAYGFMEVSIYFAAINVLIFPEN